ncbi:ABC transporter substrate-binding protein [Treponema pedis]|uniref:ABC transporter substrate-binding protein n=1 Tax=Treponema pedis TaxID=409322 RepID=UPI0019825D47|nr:ABC transporter substrate-binding protein [Treponema pedis]QSI05603.1 ABC transporter substrate-binding protein [Treponema pedis]
MKKFIKFFSCMLAAALVFAACNGGGKSGSSDKAAVKQGATVDKVIYSVATDQTIALKDVIEGKADVLFSPMPPSLIHGLSDADREKIDIYGVPSGYWTLLFNPIPNKAPYTWKEQSGEEFFNPLAIQEVRYAFNWIINRKKLVDELLLGEGKPMYTPCQVGLPGAYRYNILATKFGINEAGDEQKALDMIENAMNKAASLPENKGKLVKEGGKWLYKGKPVTIKSVMRVDDPQGRLPAARYIHAQIEKAGITVEGLERDRKTAGALVYGGNPANIDWTMYLEGWGSGGFYVTWETPLCQMYAPFYGYMPGGQEADFWNYENAQLDVYGKKAAYGQYLKADDFFDETQKMCALGIQEAIRVYVVSDNQLFVANKARIKSRLLYGVANGFNGWTIRYADVDKDTDGPYKDLRVLRVLLHSAQGSLFMTEWDPVGGQGFSDTFSSAFYLATNDVAAFDHLATGRYENWISVTDVDNAKFAPKLVKDKNGDMVMGGDIPVPKEAVVYNSASKKWVPADTSQTVSSAATGKLVDGYYWHNGQPVDIHDIRFVSALNVDWCTKDGDNDPYYDKPLSDSLSTHLNTTKGMVFNEDGSITTYKNYFHAPILRYTAIVVGGIEPKALNPGRSTCVPWDIYEALSEIVAHGSKSGTVYNFAKDGGEGGVEANIKNPDCVADIKAKLQDFIAEKHIPASLKDFVTEDYVIKRYQASIDFIDKYDHAVISSGPLMFEKIDTLTNSVILSAVDNYPYKSDYWPMIFRTDLTVIDHIKAPVNPSSDKDAVFEITVSKYAFPEVETTPLDKGTVKGYLQLPSGGEKIYESKAMGGGKFTITVPASDLAGFEKGVEHIMVVLSSIADEPPQAQSVSFTVLK